MEVTWFFNSDLEDFLASNEEQYAFDSNKRNQEFEYFLFWLEEGAVYTQKQYEKSYLDFIESWRKRPVALTANKNNLRPWNSDVSDKKKLQLLNSKITSYQFAIAHQLATAETQFYKLGEEIKSDYVYKQAFGVSGIGTWRGDLAKDKIQQLALMEDLICEPRLERFFDFSTCITEDHDFTYQNQVDDYFQYKGTTLGIDFEKFSWFETYKNDIQKIKEHYLLLGITKPFSVDSFLYRKNGNEFVYTLSEVNARKTMGYISIMLWKKYFESFRYCRLLLVNRKKCHLGFNHRELYTRFDNKIICLSPLNNLFVTFLLAENSLHELNELEDELFATIFKSIK